MEPTEKDFPILDALGSKAISTQRELADHTGIRLAPKGLETKSALAARFVIRKLREYGDVKEKLADKAEHL